MLCSCTAGHLINNSIGLGNATQMRWPSPISPTNPRNDMPPLVVISPSLGTLVASPRTLRYCAPSQYGLWIRCWASGTIQAFRAFLAHQHEIEVRLDNCFDLSQHMKVRMLEDTIELLPI